MKDNLLYFPYIDIPQNSWTIKSILYWDKVGIIVPPNYVDRPKQYKQFTIDLMQSDLVENIFPANYIDYNSRFDEGFLRLVNGRYFNLEKRQEDFQNGLYSRIHFQKFGDRLLNHLVDLRIAKRKDWQWFDVESRTAKLIMLYLATFISETGNFMPATDDINNLDITIAQRGFSSKLNSIRKNLLDELIPYPIEPDLTKLRKFKEKFHEELISFRVLLEQIAFDISIVNSEKERTTKQKLKIEEIEDKREQILSELNKSKFGQITFGTICQVTGAIISYQMDNKPLGAFSLTSAVYSALQGYDKKSTLRKEYSYLALIDKKFKKD